MREVPAGLDEAIKARTVKICEIFDFILRNGKTYYYTSHDEDIDWGNPSIRYSRSTILRDQVASSMNLEVDTMSLRLAEVSGEAGADLYNAAMNNQLEGITVVVKRIFWDKGSASAYHFTIFVGTGSVQFNRNELIVNFTSILNSLNVVVPLNAFQQPCNWALFDAGCTLNKADYKEDSTATVDAANDYSIIDSNFTPPAGDPTRYNNGEIAITSGDYDGERRNIIITEDDLFVVSVPFPGIIKAGTTFDYYPGCDGTPGCCKDRFSNKENFYGFVYLPAPEESM